MVTTVVVASKNPTAYDGGIHMPTFVNEVYAAFPGRDIWSINISDYGATVTVGFNDVVQSTDADTLSVVIAAHDPSSLTPEEQAEADQAAELASIKDKIAADTANIALITTASPDTLAPNGYKAAFVATAYNALSDADKLRLLRMTMLAVLNILLDMLRSQRYILNTIKKDKTGSITELKAQ